MTVAENVQMALVEPPQRDLPVRRPCGVAHRDRALELLDQVGMADAADRACKELAYGDVKRVELAIALANDPRLLLMDEPTAGMAPRERNDLIALVKRLVVERGSPCCSPSIRWTWCSPMPTASSCSRAAR